MLARSDDVWQLFFRSIPSDATERGKTLESMLQNGAVFCVHGSCGYVRTACDMFALGRRDVIQQMRLICGRKLSACDAAEDASNMADDVRDVRQTRLSVHNSPVSPITHFSVVCVASLGIVRSRVSLASCPFRTIEIAHPTEA